MGNYSISQVSLKLGVSKDTLRYYEKLGLITPERRESGYRTYSDSDVLDVMYIQVLKYAGFTLSDIKAIQANRKNTFQGEECTKSTMDMLRNKRDQTEQRIERLGRIIDLLDTSIGVLSGKTGNDASQVHELVQQIFREMTTDN